MEAQNFYLEYSDNEIHLHGVKRIIHCQRTKYQKVAIVDTYNYGRVLFLDDRVQSSERDSFIYHEALVHPPLLIHPHPQRVMIVGGGEGETLRTVLQHNTVTQAVMVDIDGQLVKLCARYLPRWSGGAFRDKRARVVIADARTYLERRTTKYDAIIIDLPEPMEGGPAIKLYTREFYRLIANRLNASGTMALQAGTTKPGDTDILATIVRTIRTAFPSVTVYQVNVPSFGLPWGLVLASKGADPKSFPPEEIDRLIAQRGLKGLRYYDGIAHQGMFSLPRYLRRDLERSGRIITDRQVLVTKFN